jgi:hypothetical protein
MCERCIEKIDVPDDEKTLAMIKDTFFVQGDKVYMEVGAAQAAMLETVLAVAMGADPIDAVNLIGAFSQKAVEMATAEAAIASIPPVPEPPQNTTLF